MRLPTLLTILALLLFPASTGFGEFVLQHGDAEAAARSAGPAEFVVRWVDSPTIDEPNRLMADPKLFTGDADIDLRWMAEAAEGAPAPDQSRTSCLLAAPFWNGEGAWQVAAERADGSPVVLAPGAVRVLPIRIGSIQGIQVLAQRGMLPDGVRLRLREPSGARSSHAMGELDWFPAARRVVDSVFLNGSTVDSVLVHSPDFRGAVVSTPANPGDIRITYDDGDEIIRVAMADLAIGLPEVSELKLDFHDDILPIGGTLGSDVWFYAPRVVSDIDKTDSVFATPGAVEPSPDISTRPAFSTLAPSGAEVALNRTRRFEDNLFYERGSIQPPGQRFVYHRIITGQTFHHELAVHDHLTTTAVTMSVENLGFNITPAANPDHFADYFLEGVAVPRVSWLGRSQNTGTFSLGLPALPNPPTLTFTHTVPAGSPFAGGIDFQNLEAITLGWEGYPRIDSVKQGHRLELPPAGDGMPRRLTVGGFAPGTTSSDVFVLDVTDPAIPVRLMGAPVFADVSGTVAVEFEAGPLTSVFWVQAVAGIGSPAVVVQAEELPPVPSDTLTAIFLRPAGFAASLAPLVAARGPGILEIDPQALYNAFNGGQESREAIRDGMAWYLANVPSRVPIPHVLIAAHGSLDPRDYLGLQTGAQVHPFVEDSAPSGGIAIENSIDFQYGLLEGGDGFEDAFVGRIPAKTSTDLDQAVTKILAYEAALDALTLALRPAAFITDNEVSFVADLPTFTSRWEDTGHPWTEITIPLPPTTPDIPAIKAAIRAAMEDGDGSSFIFYTGHGNVDRWASENIYNVADVPGIATAGKWPLIATFTCLSAYFARPGGSQSLGEAVIFSDDGAAGIIAPCSVDYYIEQRAFYIEVLEQLRLPENTRAATMGEAFLRARTQYLTTYPGFTRTAHEYLLFADPQTGIPLQPISKIPVDLWIF